MTEEKREQEKIRKFLIKEVMGHLGVLDIEGDKIVNNTKNELWRKALTWLEKQKIKEHDVCDTCDEKASCVNPCPTKLIEEQKPTDKVELKFKVGEWVVYCGKTCKITGLHNGIFTITNQDGSYFFNRVESTTEPVFHLWTIEEAKNGDVLYLQHGEIDNYVNDFRKYMKGE